MSGSTLYDDDILLWSEQQVAAIRKLGEFWRNLPNELDIENVAEEIESVGRSELAAVKSDLRLIFLHLIKLPVETESQAISHWRGEIVGFHSEMLERHAFSMWQRIDVDAIWRSAREQSILALGGPQQRTVAELPVHCPISLEGLLADGIDSAMLLESLGR